MFRPKNLPPPTVRLPKQQAMPSLNDVQFMLVQAERNKGRTVEMPYSLHGQPFMITVRIDEDTYDTSWAYYKGDDETMPADLVWVHPTGDVNLIHNLVLTSLPGGEEQFDAGNYMAVRADENPRRTHTGVEEVSSRTTLSNLDQQVIRDRAKAILEGDLANMQIPTLLQSITMSKMTGRLQLQNRANMAVIYFDDGVPVHATAPETQGDVAIIEIITWEEGQFHFVPNETTDQRTVKRRLDGMLMEGVTLLDQTRFLREKNCQLESFVLKTNPNLTEEQFAQAVSRGAPIDVNVQKRFYAAIDNRSTLLDVLRRCPMLRIEWTPIMFNLLSCDLVTVVDTPPPGGKASRLTATILDRQAIQSVVRMLTRPETGLYTYPAFMFFMEQEFFKCAALGMPLTLVVFEMRVRYGDLYESVPLNYVRNVAQRIEPIKRSIDVLAHYETFDFAILMPNTYSKAAKIFCHRINEVVGSEQIIPGPANQIALNFGIAMAPDDTQDLGYLISAAKEAKIRARDSNVVATLFSDIEIK